MTNEDEQYKKDMEFFEEILARDGYSHELDGWENDPEFWDEPCPRCGAKSHIVADWPYCLECDWDSLHDPSYQRPY